MKTTKHGLISNFIYAWKMSIKGGKGVLVATLFIGIFQAMNALIWVYAPKWIVSFVEQHYSVSKFVLFTALVCAVLFISNALNRYGYTKLDYEFVKTNAFLERLRMRKMFKTDFKNMENPDFLDFGQKAKNALYQGNGFHGVLYESHNIISNSIIIVFSSVMIGMRNIWVLIAILFMAIIVGYILGWFGKRDKIKFQDVMAPTNRKLNYLERTSKNFDFAKDIRLFNMSGVFKREFAVLNNFFFKKNRQHHNRWIIGALCMESVLLSETLVMYGWLVWSVLKGEMAISDLLLFIGLVNSLHRNIGFMSWIYSAVKTNTLMINDYREFVNWKEDSESFAEGEGVEKNLDFDSYEFKFENVSFKYPGHDNYVLKNINLTIKNDSKLAVVGINGAGKTTLIKLIMKLYNPTEGRILLNGRDLRDFDRDEYFKLFSPVFQNIECFALPIFENVSFEVEEETDMDKVTSALERSGLLEKIDMYDAGIRVNLLKIFDEKGIDLSGGEKQKLALARALYKDAPIVILDEPTAALDALAEDRMYREFNNMVKNKIAIFISHRLGSTRFCDQIAMFKEGEIVELGTHSELLEKNGEYAEMFNIQSSYYKDEEVISHG